MNKLLFILYSTLLLSFFLVKVKASNTDSLLIKIAKEPVEKQIEYLLSKSSTELNKNSKQGFIYGSKALELASKKKDNIAIVRAIYYKGTHMIPLGKIDSAIVLLKSGIEYCTDIDSLKYRIPILSSLGNAYYRSGNIDSAVNIYTKAIELCNTDKELSELKMANLNSLAVIYYQQSDYRKAVKQFIELYNMCHQDTSISKGKEARYAGNIGSLFYTMKDYDKALEYFQKAKNIFIELNAEIQTALSNENIGMVYIETGKPDSAISYISNAIKVYKKMSYKVQIANSGINLSNAYITNNNANKALEHINEALEIIQTNKLNNLQTEAYLTKAKALYYINNINEAAVYFKLAKEFVDTKNQIELLIKIEKLGADIYKKRGNYYNSLLCLEKYIRLNDSIQNVKVKKDIANLEAKYESEIKEEQIQKLSAEKANQELTIKTEKRNKQLIFIISILITVIGASSSILYRTRQQQKRIRLNKTKAELENRLLRVQMNPHFIFNSLNSVQSYISSSQNELAEDYLARFALLTRYILNNSREDFILFSNEIETLDTYLQLEQQRFNHHFDFKISIDDSIDEETIKVPPMLTQPFVENAILHGLTPKKDKGKISINFNPYKKSEQIIECTIIDNGIGREAATKVQKGSKHKSLGLQLTSERLQLIESQTGFETRFETIDLFDENKIATGTMVKIIFPCKKLY